MPDQGRQTVILATGMLKGDGIQVVLCTCGSVVWDLDAHDHVSQQLADLAEQHQGEGQR